MAKKKNVQTFEKRRKEDQRKRKQEEKRQRRFNKGSKPGGSSGYDEAAPADSDNEDSPATEPEVLQ